MTAAPADTVRIPDAAKASAAAALASLTALDDAVPDTSAGLYLEHGAKQLRNHLPPTVLAALSRWRYAPTPWLTLSNLPEAPDRVPTPSDGFCDESLLKVPNLVHFGLLHLLGLTPVAYQWENHGRLIRNVAPRPDSARTSTSWGYAQPLDWHTDDSVLDHHEGAAPAESIPHYLSFYGMRNHEQVPTGLLAVDTVLAALPDQVTAELAQPQFAVSAPESYAAGADGTALTRTDVALLWTLPDGNTGLRYGPGRVTGLTPWARAALERFEECLARLDGTDVLVAGGGFHIFDNRRVLHRRVPFEPAAPGHARWLRRCYAQARTS